MYWENQSNNDKEEFYNYYLLDGNSGKTTYLGLLHEGYISTDFEYLIYQDSKVRPKIKFIIYSFETKKHEKELLWSLNSEKYFTEEENSTYIFRSNLPEYDFHIFIVGMGRYIFAEGYLNINDNTIVTLADDEEEDRILDLDQISRFEFGK